MEAVSASAEASFRCISASWLWPFCRDASLLGVLIGGGGMRCGLAAIGKDFCLAITKNAASTITAATAQTPAKAPMRLGLAIGTTFSRLISIPSDRARATNLWVIPEGISQRNRFAASWDNP
jgi:hypothetical protein